jgi:hypothetical protein
MARLKKIKNKKQSKGQHSGDTKRSQNLEYNEVIFLSSQFFVQNLLLSFSNIRIVAVATSRREVGIGRDGRRCACMRSGNHTVLYCRVVLR